MDYLASRYRVKEQAMNDKEKIAALREALSEIAISVQSQFVINIALKALKDTATAPASQTDGDGRDAWSPIETPPERWMEVMVWPYPSNYCMTAEFDGEGWQYSEQDRDGAFWSVCKPTHWMPMPIPPDIALQSSGTKGNQMNKDELPELRHRADCHTRLGPLHLCNCDLPLREARKQIEELRAALAAVKGEKT
jgi:hypothetical protein